MPGRSEPQCTVMEGSAALSVAALQQLMPVRLPLKIDLKYTMAPQACWHCPDTTKSPKHGPPQAGHHLGCHLPSSSCICSTRRGTRPRSYQQGPADLSSISSLR